MNSRTSRMYMRFLSQRIVSRAIIYTSVLTRAAHVCLKRSRARALARRESYASRVIKSILFCSNTFRK